jgi:uncharacterized protein
MRISVNHAHVTPESINPNGTIQRLLALMDDCEIDEAIAFAPFPAQCDAVKIDANRWLAGELSAQPRLRGFGTIDFRRDDLVDQVRRAKDLGMLGLKLHPNVQHFAILSDKAKTVYAAASDAGLFVTFHSGLHQSRLRDCRVIDFDEVAWDFPKLRFSLEHVGGYSFFNEALAVIFNHVAPPWKPAPCNVYGGLASIFTTHQNRMWHLSREQLLELHAQVGADQLIFGLDFPYNQQRETKMGLETIRGLGLPDADVEKILGGNLRRVLHW